MPVLILLIYYMHDLFKIQRYYSQTEFVAYQMVQMIQTISQNRSDKKITQDDLKNIFTAANLSIYPANDFSDLIGGHKLGHMPESQIFYVEGNSDGTASVIWVCTIYMWNSSQVISSPRAIRIGIGNESVRGRTNVAKNVDPKVIHSKLSIKSGDKKIIIETKICYEPTKYYRFGDGTYCNSVPINKAFGLYLVTPKGFNNNSGSPVGCGYFNSVVVFSPNPDLFTNTAPQ